MESGFGEALTIAVGLMQSSSQCVGWRWPFLSKPFLWCDCGCCSWKLILKPISPTKKSNPIQLNCISNWILIFTMPPATSEASAWGPWSGERTWSTHLLFLLSFSSSVGSCRAGSGRMDEEKNVHLTGTTLVPSQRAFSLGHTYLCVFYLWAIAHVLPSNLLHSLCRYFSWAKLIVSFQKFTCLHFIQRLFLCLQWFIFMDIIFVSTDIN